IEWIAERSGGLYREEGRDIIPTLDRPEVQEAVADWLTIRDQVTAMVSGPLFLTTEEILNHIAEGEVGIAVLPLWDVADLLPQYPGLAIAPLPPAYFVGSHAVRPSSELAVSAGTAHPDAVWEWVRFVSRQPLGSDWPARRSVAEASGIQEQVSTEIAQVVLASLENQAGRLRLDPQVSRALYGGLSRALVFIHTPQDIASTLAAVQKEAVAAIHAWQEERAAVSPVPVSVSPPPLPGGGEQEIAFLVPTSSYEPVYTAAAEAFTSAHPDRHVTVSFMRSEQPGCLATYVPNNSLVLMQTMVWFSLADLSPLAEQGQFPEDDFVPQAIAAVKWRGRLYAVPGMIKPLVLYYNPYIFRRAGLELPTVDWTVEDILTAAEQIEATTEDWGYLIIGDDVPFLLEQQGIPLFTDERPPRPRFTEPEVLDALDRLHRLRGGEGSIVTPPSAITSRMMSGKVGLWLNVWFDLFDYLSPGFGPIGTAEGPLEPGVTVIRLRPGTRLPVRVGIYGLDREAAHPQACWEWINFLAQQGVTPQHELPALRRLIASEATRQRLGDELFTAYTEALRQDEGAAAHDTTVEDWATWWFVEAIRNAAPGELEAALASAQQHAEAFIACLGPGGGADLEQAQACAAQVDPNHPLAALAP
ncbi:MAG: extracellular solute-binding protein, partial [Anaerolineae bacterium]|nr:extracellular solute-binding protein [Anaerolineae bacterium]